MPRSRSPDPAAADVTVTVTRDESALRVTRADGTLVFFAPVTTGSEHDPLPPGDWKVTAVSWKPTFHYNPDLFWDAKPRDEQGHAASPARTTRSASSGSTLNIEHYGIHGTPEPWRVGHTESHGCVRLTNWDAARLAALVRPGHAGAVQMKGKRAQRGARHSGARRLFLRRHRAPAGGCARARHCRPESMQSAAGHGGGAVHEPAATPRRRRRGLAGRAPDAVATTGEPLIGPGPPSASSVVADLQSRSLRLPIDEADVDDR